MLRVDLGRGCSRCARSASLGGSRSPAWDRRAHPALSAQAPSGTLRWHDRRERETEMSWQTPGKEPPPDPAAPEPDAETTRVPLQPAPSDPGVALGCTVRGPARARRPIRRPRLRLISAAPVGWAGPETPAAAPAMGRPCPGHRPSRRPRRPVTEGLVIAGVFSRARRLRHRHRVPPAPQPGRARSGRGARGRPGPDGDARRGRPVRRRRPPLLRRPVDQRLAGDARACACCGCGSWARPTRRTLPFNDALPRWLALSGAIVDPRRSSRASAGTSGWSGAVWLLVLLITTATNPLHQGLHDRWARSVVVQPAPGGSGPRSSAASALSSSCSSWLVPLARWSLSTATSSRTS